MEFFNEISFSIYIIAACIFAAVFLLVKAIGSSVASSLALYQSQFTESAEVELSDLFIFADPKKMFVLNVVTFFVVPTLVHMLWQIWIVTGGVAVALLFVPPFVYRSLRSGRLKKFEAQLPDAYMMISSSLQAGASFNLALADMVERAPSPLAQEFGLLLKKIKLGVALEDGLLEMEERIPLDSFIMASSAIRISKEVGGNLVTTIESMADTLRRKKTMEGKIESLTAQGKVQGKFMAGLPILIGVILSMMEPEAMSQLVTTSTGIAILVGLVVMEAIGFFIINKITSIDV